VYGENWDRRDAPAGATASEGRDGTGVAGSVSARLITNPEMELAGRQFRGLPAYSLPSAASSIYDGFFGVRALKLRGLSFDRATQTMYLLN